MKYAESFTVFRRGFPGNLPRMRRLGFLLIALLCVSAPASGAGDDRPAALDALPGARRGQPERAPHAATRSRPRHAGHARPSRTSGPSRRTRVRRRHRRLPPAAPAGSAATCGCRPRRRRRPCPRRHRRRSRSPPSRRRRRPPSPRRHRRRRFPTPPTAPPCRARAGLRVTFGAGQADLSPASAAAIQQTWSRSAPPATPPASTSWPMPPARRTILRPRGGCRCRGRWRCAAR